MHRPQLIGQHQDAAEQEFGGIAVVVTIYPAIGAGVVDQLVQLYGERDDIAGQDEQRGLGRQGIGLQEGLVPGEFQVEVGGVLYSHSMALGVVSFFQVPNGSIQVVRPLIQHVAVFFVFFQSVLLGVFG